MDPLGLNKRLAIVWAVGSYDALKAKPIINEAYNFGWQMNKLMGGSHNRPADASRYCYWMCATARTIGADQADPPQPSKKRDMDLYNNCVGFGECASSIEDSCKVSCIKDYEEGKLMGIDGKLMNPMKCTMMNESAELGRGKYD